MGAFKEALDQIRVAFGRLSSREQFLVLGCSAGLMLLAMVATGVQVANAIEREERRVRTKTEQLWQVLSLQGSYSARQREHKERMATLARSNLRLVSWVEDSARQAGVDIGQLHPEDAEPTPDGIVESRVDLRASGLSADRLQNFINRCESAPGVVLVRHLKIERPYRRDVADIEMSISTFRLKGP